MTDTNLVVMHGVLVEEEIQFTLLELSRACNADSEQLIALVGEGVLLPTGADPPSWLFGGNALPRARLALRLGHDLELSADATALVLDLLEEIEALRSRLRHYG